MQPDTRVLFLTAAGMSIALLVVACIINPPAPTPRREGRPHDGLLSVLRLPGVARAIITSAVIFSAVDLTVVYLPALGLERNLPAITVGWLLATRAIASMASRLILGRAAALMGRGRLMGMSIALAAVSFAVLALPVPTLALFVVAIALGLGLGVGQPLTMSWVAEQVPGERRGTALSVRLAGNRLSQLTVPAVVGAPAATSRAGVVLAATGVIMAATLLLIRGVHLDGD